MTLFCLDWVWSVLVHFENFVIALGVLYLIVSGVNGQDQMNQKHLISYTHRKVLLMFAICMHTCNNKLICEKMIKNAKYNILCTHICTNIYTADRCIKPLSKFLNLHIRYKTWTGDIKQVPLVGYRNKSWIYLSLVN